MRRSTRWSPTSWGGFVLDAYLSELARCATVNQFNRLHITLENTLAPAEVCALIDRVRAGGLEVPAPAAHWLARSDELLRGGGRQVQPYLRHRIAEGATMYAATGTAVERAARTLLVAFSGDANRMMMPTALFLQHLAAARHEVLLLVDRTRRFYLGGVAGLGDDLPSTIRRIEAIAAPSRFARAVAFGTSAGGLAAVWAGVELRLARAVSVGGVAPEAVAERVQTQDLDTRGFDEALRRHAHALPEVVLVAGETNLRDTEKALQMAARLPARYVVVPGSTHHNVLWDVWQRGELDGFLADLIG